MSCLASLSFPPILLVLHTYTQTPIPIPPPKYPPSNPLCLTIQSSAENFFASCCNLPLPRVRGLRRPLMDCEYFSYPLGLCSSSAASCFRFSLLPPRPRIINSTGFTEDRHSQYCSCFRQVEDAFLGSGDAMKILLGPFDCLAGKRLLHPIAHIIPSRRHPTPSIASYIYSFPSQKPIHCA